MKFTQCVEVYDESFKLYSSETDFRHTKPRMIEIPIWFSNVHRISSSFFEERTPYWSFTKHFSRFSINQIPVGKKIEYEVKCETMEKMSSSWTNSSGCQVWHKVSFLHWISFSTNHCVNIKNVTRNIVVGL